MKIKLFVSVFFGSIKLILLYFIIISASIYFIMIQFKTLATIPDTIEIPDIEIVGFESDLVYEMYENISTAKQRINNELNNSNNFYGVIGRNLFNFSDPFYQVSFYIYGVEDSFLERLKTGIAIGDLPKPSKKEAIIGSNIAAYYQLNIGDIIEENILLSPQNSNVLENEYIVAGILSSKDIYFSNAVYISKDTYFLNHDYEEDNMGFLYVNTKHLYKQLSNSLKKLEQNSEIGKSNFNAKIKSTEKYKLYKNLIFGYMGSFLIIGFLLINFNKGISKKVGIIKALGISDGYIITILCFGFGIIITSACLINTVIGLTIFEINVSLLLSIIIMIGISIYLYMLISILVVYKRILPRDSMLSN